jgi:carboxypeptidase C (cathepsin A)
MLFRLCWLLLAVFLASCSGGSDSEQSTSSGTFDPPVAVSLDHHTAPDLKNTVLSFGANDSLSYGANNSFSYLADELRNAVQQSSREQTITLNGTTIPFTATAGHLIIGSDGSISANGHAVGSAIFYTAYTRNDLPRETRPITFIFNGGPGGSSADLDLGFLGPKDVDEDASLATKSFLLKDNPNTLLDKTDLVFVDPIGTGYSVAISPSKNEDFWGVDNDAKVLYNFITSYLDIYNRQSSPQYIYGVSYGGFRAPIIVRFLIESGTRMYGPRPGDKPADALKGMILNSPLLDGTTDCYQFYVSCGGALPTYAMIKAFHDKSIGRPDFGLAAFLINIRTFAGDFSKLYATVFSGVSQKIPDRSSWEAFLKGPDAPGFLGKLFRLTGIGKIYEPGDSGKNNPWIENPNMDAVQFTEKFETGRKLLLTDGREFLPPRTTDPSFDDTDIYYDYIKRYQADFIGYQSKSRYLGFNGVILGKWDYEPKPGLSLSQDRWRTSIPDLAYSMTLNPKLNVLVQHGYYDLNTPFHLSELNVENAGLSARIPVKSYEGGHGVAPYGTERYDKLPLELKAFYDQAPAKVLTALNSSLAEGRGNE